MTKRKDSQIRTLKRQLRKALIRGWLWRSRAIDLEVDLEIAMSELDFADQFQSHQMRRAMGVLH